MLGGIGTTEFIIITAVGLLFFGNKKMKELARGLGESQKEVKNIKKEFDKAAEEMEPEFKDAVDERGDY